MIYKYIILLLCGFFVFNIYADQIDDLMSGPPKFIGKQMDAKNYVEVKAQRLANAKIVWFNFELAKDMGLNIPILTPTIEKKLLDQYAYMVPNRNDAKSSYIDKYKTFYADRYGGDGLHANYGSGRAMSSGLFQAKGGGVTPLVSSYNDFNHSHGGAALYKMAQEAVWGEITNKNLPLGGNRVLMIIDTGTFTIWDNGSHEARAILVREDPLRPAHFVDCYGSGCKLDISEFERKEAQMKFLTKALPMPENFTATDDLGQTIKMGLQEMSRRIARQFAAASALRIFHGAPSASNIEIDGTFLDFETITTLSGYGKAFASKHAPTFDQEVKGHIDGTLNIMFETIDSYYAARDSKVHKKLPTIEEMSKFIMKEYRKYRLVEFLKLTGVPENICQELSEKEVGKVLAKKIISLAFNFNSKTFNVDQSMPPTMGMYQIDKLLVDLARNRTIDSEILNSKYSDISQSYKMFIDSAYELAKNDNYISENGFRNYIAERAEIRNQKIPELYRVNLRSDFIQMVDNYLKNKNTSLISDAINDRVANGQRIFPDAGIYQPVSYYKKNIDGSITSIIYDAVKNKYLLTHSINLNKTTEKIANSFLRYSTDNWQSFKEITPSVLNKQATFTIPLTKRPDTIEWAIHDEKLKKWWKDGDSNFRITRNPSKDCDHLLH